MKPYVVAPDAAEDLDEIWEYIARDDIDSADSVLAKIHEQIRALADMPGMGKL